MDSQKAWSFVALGAWSGGLDLRLGNSFSSGQAETSGTVSGSEFDQSPPLPRPPLSLAVAALRARDSADANHQLEAAVEHRWNEQLEAPPPAFSELIALLSL